MRIGVIVDNQLTGDIRVLREAAILKKQGHEIFVLCFDFSGNSKDPVSGINISRIRIPRKLKDILFFFMNLVPLYEWMWSVKIRSHILKNQIEILHVHDLYMSRAAHSGIKRSGKKIPMILDLHENYPFTILTYNWTKGFPRKLLSRPEAWQKKEREYLGYADSIIVLSGDFRDALIGKYPGLNEKKFTVFPNVPDLSQPEYQHKKKIEKPFGNNFPVLFYYGVIAERRGIFDAMRVFKELINEDYPVNFLLIGPVDKKDRILFTEMKGDLPADRIHYIPWINSKEFPGYLEISDICLAPFHKNPQHESGIANKIYDYMLGGKPLVASNCVPQQNLIEECNCGIVFDNIKEFHDSIIMLLNDEPLRKQMGENGKKAVFVKYNVENFQSNLILLYKNDIFRQESFNPELP